MGVSQIHFHPEEVPIQQQQIIITGTVNFNSNNYNFRTLSSQGLFESTVRNISPNKASTVILGLSTLSGTNPQITPNRYDEHPRHFYWGVPPLPGTYDSCYA